DEWIMPFDVIEIIEIPELGSCAAKTACEQLGVKDQYDSANLKQAKQMCYLRGFYEGVMLVEEYKGMPVQEAKEIVKAKMVKEGDAFIYSEPEDLILSRSGSRCVVASVNQWYLDYGAEDWKNRCLEHMGVSHTVCMCC
ncbi:hypothetical protein KIPB_015052, partial [Kipferlia bialata]